MYLIRSSKYAMMTQCISHKMIPYTAHCMAISTSIYFVMGMCIQAVCCILFYATADGTVGPCSIAVRANAEGEKELIQV